MVLESNLKESAANILLTQATAEALAGESAEAGKTLSAVIKLGKNSIESQSQIARVMALNGQATEAEQIIERLVRENPSDTKLNAIDVPLVLAAGQLDGGHAGQALRTLDPLKPYELGSRAGLLPNYLRGIAYLRLQKNTEAAAEFNAVLAHRGVAPTTTIWILSQLNLGRAHAMASDKTKAKAAYLDFLNLWKDADPDLPILKHAKAEYAKLQ
jgi:eukaryotic-like serine/threonine-protein kinase